MVKLLVRNLNDVTCDVTQAQETSRRMRGEENREKGHVGKPEGACSAKQWPKLQWRNRLARGTYTAVRP